MHGVSFPGAHNAQDTSVTRVCRGTVIPLGITDGEKYLWEDW